MWPKIFSPKGTSRGTAYLFIPNKATNLQNLGYIITLVFSYKYNSTARFNPKAKSHYCKRLPAPLSLMLLFIKPKTYPLFLEIRHSDVQLFFKAESFPLHQTSRKQPCHKEHTCCSKPVRGLPTFCSTQHCASSSHLRPRSFQN